MRPFLILNIQNQTVIIILLLMTISNFYLVTLSFCFGILLSTWYPLPLPIITWLVLLGVVLIIFWSRSLLTSEIRASLFCGVFILALSLGALRVDFAEQAFNNSLLENEVGSVVELKGLVVKAPDVRSNSVYLEVKTETDKVLVSVDRYAEVGYGDEVLVSGKLANPESFETDLGRIFNYPGYLKAKGIEYRISFADVELLSKGNGNVVIASLLKFKQAFMTEIEANISEPAAGLGEGLLLGVKQALGEDLESAFRETGIIHIVVLSGYNIMLVVIFVMYMLSYVLPSRPRVIVGIIAIISFALLVGLSATVVRASIMASLLLIMQVTGRQYLVLRGLMLAGLVMLLINPYLLVYDVGFQLSFMATLGLILISPHLERWLYKVPEWFGARTFLTATISTQIAVLPLLLYQIGEFSVVAVIVNVLVLPMVPVAMLLTFLTGLVSFIFPVATIIFAYPAYLSLLYIIEIALWFSRLPFASFIIPAFPLVFVPLLYGGMSYTLWRLHDQSIKYGYSELGESLLHRGVKKAKDTDDLSDWEIVEEVEVDVDKVDIKKEAGHRPASKSDTPIFFR